MELMGKRRKHFAALRAQENRNRPPTKAQKRSQMSTYLKHMSGYTYKQLKGKSFDEIQKLFDREMKKVNTFVAMGSEVQENKEKKEEGREETTKGSRKKMLGRKRAVKEQQEESSKKQKDEDITIDAIPPTTKLPVIIEYKLHKEGMLVHYELIRADGSSKRCSSMIRMLQGIDREDLEALWRIVKGKYGDTRREDEFERVLYRDLRVMFEPDIKSDVWRMCKDTWYIMEIMLSGCDPLALVDDFTSVEDNIRLLETKFDEEEVFVFVFLEDVTGSVNLTLLSLFFGVTTTNFPSALLILGQKKRTRLRTCTKIHQEVLFSEHGDGVISIKQRRLSGDGVWILATASQRLRKPAFVCIAVDMSREMRVHRKDTIGYKGLKTKQTRFGLEVEVWVWLVARLRLGSGSRNGSDARSKVVSSGMTRGIIPLANTKNGSRRQLMPMMRR
ncbi:hypothetical protein Tco_1238525 [Tanacetum coccineum]